MKQDVLLRVHWDDTVGWDGWHGEVASQEFADDIRTDYYTTGYLVKLAETHITVAQSVRVQEDGHTLKYGDLEKIPLVSIIAVHRLSLGRKVRL